MCVRECGRLAGRLGGWVNGHVVVLVGAKKAGGHRCEWLAGWLAGRVHGCMCGGGPLGLGLWMGVPVLELFSQQDNYLAPAPTSATTCALAAVSLLALPAAIQHRRPGLLPLWQERAWQAPPCGAALPGRSGRCASLLLRACRSMREMRSSTPHASPNWHSAQGLVTSARITAATEAAPLPSADPAGKATGARTAPHAQFRSSCHLRGCPGWLAGPPARTARRVP
jgi:hypothetical protein